MRILLSLSRNKRVASKLFNDYLARLNVTLVRVLLDPFWLFLVVLFLVVLSKGEHGTCVFFFVFCLLKMGKALAPASSCAYLSFFSRWTYS